MLCQLTLHEYITHRIKLERGPVWPAGITFGSRWQNFFCLFIKSISITFQFVFHENKERILEWYKATMVRNKVTIAFGQAEYVFQKNLPNRLEKISNTANFSIWTFEQPEANDQYPICKKCYPVIFSSHFVWIDKGEKMRTQMISCLLKRNDWNWKENGI